MARRGPQWPGPVHCGHTNAVATSSMDRAKDICVEAAARDASRTPTVSQSGTAAWSARSATDQAGESQCRPGSPGLPPARC